MVKSIQVAKRDGSKEPLDLEKLHKVIIHACDGVNGVSPSQVELNSHISFADGITSAEIQETMIKAAADLISEETPNYQLVGHVSALAAVTQSRAAKVSVSCASSLDELHKSEVR